MHHKMLVEVTVEQDGGRSPVGTKDEQKKRLIAAALNNKRNKESRRRTRITPKKKMLKKIEEERNLGRTTKKRRINSLGIFCFKITSYFSGMKIILILKQKIQIYLPSGNKTCMTI